MTRRAVLIGAALAAEAGLAYAQSAPLAPVSRSLDPLQILVWLAVAVAGFLGANKLNGIDRKLDALGGLPERVGVAETRLDNQAAEIIRISSYRERNHP